jgi:hypothetical protein
MNANRVILEDFEINRLYEPSLKSIADFWRFRTYVDILFVVDAEIAAEPGVGFGVGSVIEHLRNTRVGCKRFRVNIALRNGEAPTVVNSPGEFEPNYRGFRFDMQDGSDSVINKYDQIWCFGFKPSNSGSSNDAEIDLASSFPTNDGELAVLATWMDNRKGGLFGTGDHHFLGASMCRHIPRLGTMRRWTNADGVPPIDTPDRIDTLRPPSAAYEPGAPGGPLPLGNGPHQGDMKVQPISWATWKWSYWPFWFRKRPHPVLCHPTLGPIDVMPDHAHEGLCVPTVEINLGATFDFNGNGAIAEYPNSGTGGPVPKIIAYGSTLGDPPYNFSKGPQPARASFPMISVYDGHPAGVGRVATDSTWHHWMDFNITNIKNANNDDWKKISRYYVNLALWLDPPGRWIPCLYLSAIASHVSYPGFQGYEKSLTTRQLGREFKQYLSIYYGPCWVTNNIWDHVWEVKPKLWEIIQHLESPRDFRGIDAEIIEETFLGTIVKQTSRIAHEIREGVSNGNEDVKIKIEDPEYLLKEAVESSLTQTSHKLYHHYEKLLEVIKVVGDQDS